MEINANASLSGTSSLTAVKKSTAATSAPTEGNPFATSTALETALQNTPDIRADRVAKARAALSSDGYPPDDAVKKISTFLAGQIQNTEE